jgi:O-antigen/teichoic acid export membrane protein
MTAGLGATAARGAGVTLASQGVRFILQFGSLIILARLLTPADFGLVAMVTAITGVAEIIRDFGLSTAAIQAKTLSDDERTNLFWVNVSIGAGCAVLAAVASPLIENLYGTAHVASITLALAGLFLISGANTQFRAELSRELRFSALAKTDILSQLAGVSVAIAMAVAGCGFWSIVGQQATFVITSLVANVWFCRWRPGWWRRGVPIGRFFRFGFGVLGTQVLGYGVNNVDNVAIGAVYGAGPLGLYGRAYQLLLVPLRQVTAPLLRVVLPVLSRVKDDREVFLRYVGSAQLVGSHILGTAFAIAAGLAVPEVAILFGAKWSGVAPIFAALAVGGVFRALMSVPFWIYLALGRTGDQLRMTLMTHAGIAALMLAGLYWGPVGVAIGHSVGYLFGWAASLWHVNRTTGLPMMPLFVSATRAMVVLSAPAGAMAYLGTRLVDGSAWQLLLGLALAALWLLAATLISPVERRTAQRILRIVRTMGPGRRGDKPLAKVSEE